MGKPLEDGVVERVLVLRRIVPKFKGRYVHRTFVTLVDDLHVSIFRIHLKDGFVDMLVVIARIALE